MMNVPVYLHNVDFCLLNSVVFLSHTYSLCNSEKEFDSCSSRLDSTWILISMMHFNSFSNELDSDGYNVHSEMHFNQCDDPCQTML